MSSQRAAWTAELRAIARLAGPFALTNLAHIAMGTTDVLMLGWLGADALAAGALGSNLYFMAMIFGMGLINATSPMIARALGRGGDAQADVRRTVHAALWSAALVAVPCWCVLWGSEAILVAMGQDATLAATAGRFVRALQWALLPFFGYVVLRQFIGTLERPGWSLAIGLAAVAFNAVANWGLIFGNFGLPALGVAGSGLATLLSSTAMFAALATVVCVDRQFRAFRVFEGLWRADGERLRAFWRLGLPMAATLSFEITVFNASVFAMGLIDAASLAAHAIVSQIGAVTFMVPLGVGQAATVRVGLAHGAADRDGVTRAGWSALALGVGFMALMSLAMILAPRRLIGAFLDVANPANAAVVALAVQFLAVVALFQIADGVQAVGSGMLRGLHDATTPMLYALGGYWGIGAPLGVALAFWAGFGGVGIWIGLATGIAVVAALMLRRWLRREQGYRKWKHFS